MELPRRKPNRLIGYDYSTNGVYFVTVCVKDKHKILWKPHNVGTNCVRPLPPANECDLNTYYRNKYELSYCGNVVENEIHKIHRIYQSVYVDKYCIMPDHIHMIIVIDHRQCNILNDKSNVSTVNGRTQFAPTDKVPSLSRIIKQFKGSITKQLGYTIWQKSFHDEIIRNEKMYKEILGYIEDNPKKYIL